MVNSTSTSGFSIIPFDTSILMDQYSAQLALQAARTAPRTTNTSNKNSPAVVAPWQSEPDRSLASRINEVRNIDKFIDPKSDIAKTAGDDKDAQAMFVLYEALTRLKTIAEYGADSKTPSALLSSLDKKFQQGLGEVQSYLQSVDLDKLTVMFGDKKSNIESAASLGKNRSETVGQVVTSGRNEVIPGLTGTEVFTVTLDKSSSTADNIAIDLSQIGKPLTIGNIAAYINEQIAAIPSLDSGGNPALDADGNVIAKYTTRFRTEKVADDSYALKIDGSSIEDVSFSAAASEPALYITGDHKGYNTDAVTTGTLTQLTGLDTTNPDRIFRNDVAGLDDAPLVLPPSTKSDTGTTDSSTDTTAAADATPEATPQETTTSAVAADSQGNLFVLGQSEGNFGSQLNDAATRDVYLTKYNAAGDVVWSRLLGASDKASGYSITVDGNDNAIIAGQINNDIGATDLFEGKDSFIAKYSSDGTGVWTKQFDTIPSDAALAVTVDASNNVIVAGQTSGALNSSSTHGGGRDAYVVKLDGTSGATTATTQYGGAGDEFASSVGVAADGNIVVAGVESGQAVVRKLDANNLSNVLYSVNLGSLDNGSVQALKVDGNAIYVAGYTGNASLGTSQGGTVTESHQGSTDGFVTRIDDNGTSGSVTWTSYAGTAAGDTISDLAVNNGNVYVAGTTSGTLAGQVKSGSSDAFAAKIDGTTGAQAWVDQIGGLLGQNGATGVAFSSTGYSVLNKLGFASGKVETSQTRDIITQTSARAGDYFYISINGGRKQKVTINAGDDFRDLAQKINRLSFRYVKAEQTAGSSGGTLKIQPQHDASIELFSGDGNHDALKSLGIEPQKILPTSELYSVGEDAAGTDPDNLGGVFALNLASNFNVRDKNATAYVNKQLEAAIGTVQRAFRSLTYDPVKAQLLEQSKFKGEVPAYLQKQLASYQDALVRISSITGTGYTV